MCAYAITQYTNKGWLMGPHALFGIKMQMTLCTF